MLKNRSRAQTQRLRPEVNVEHCNHVAERGSCRRMEKISFENINNTYCTPNMIKVITSRGTRRVVRTGEREMNAKLFLENLKERTTS